MDANTLQFLIKNSNTRDRKVSRMESVEEEKDVESLDCVFFLVNYLKLDYHVANKNDFNKLFVDFYYHLVDNFKEFKVCGSYFGVFIVS